MKGLIASLLLITISLSSSGQTLFTYGTDKVTTTEFLNAYRKNNTGDDNAKAREDYLELYTRFRLKVREAYALKLDTLASQKSDLQGFRKQIEGPFLTDNQELDRMTVEAFERSQKDIRVSHIFIPYRADYVTNPFDARPATAQDSARAAQRAEQVKARLAKGDDFAQLAKEFSADPSAATNGGDMGWITTFVLPYALENAAYGLKDGEASGALRTRIGYHFIKRTGERAALGTMNVEQILIAREPNATPEQDAAVQHLADSLYKAIQAGSNFEDLARQYSNDRTSYQAGGQIPPVTVGQYEAAFEQAVFNLKKDGEVSAPIRTSFGLHIIKRLTASPVSQNREKALPDLRAKVNADPRKQVARERFEEKVLSVTGLKDAVTDLSKLWVVTDSALLRKKELTINGLGPKSPLFRIKDRTVTVGDWFKYIGSIYVNDVDAPKKYNQHLNIFRTLSAVTYYSDHLEDYDASYRDQLVEFRDGNLLFEIMERKVWNKASADPAALRRHFEANRAKYDWGPSVEAILINAVDSASAVSAQQRLKADPKIWRDLAAGSAGALQLDSGRYEITQIRSNDPKNIKPGYLSPVLVNPSDRTATATIVLAVHEKASPRNFDEARGMVINDYQQVLEDQWVAELKKKYPVKLDRAAWDKIKSNPGL